MSWYALFVETGREEQVKKYIHHMMSFYDASVSYELLIAKREVREKKGGKVQIIVKRMFPGYILLETENILEFYLMLRAERSEYLYGVLRRDGYFKEIELEEISNVVYMTDSDGVIGSSDIFVENDRIIVTKGPLKNYDGLINKIDRRKRRVKAEFKFNGKTHYMDLSVNFIEKLNEIDRKEIPFSHIRQFE